MTHFEGGLFLRENHNLNSTHRATVETRKMLNERNNDGRKGMHKDLAHAVTSSELASYTEKHVYRNQCSGHHIIHTMQGTFRHLLSTGELLS